MIQAAGYDPESDLENPTGSVFCAHGAGFVVPWDQVEDYMHLDYVTGQERQEQEESFDDSRRATVPAGKTVQTSRMIRN